MTEPSAADLAEVEAQLGRAPRGVVEVAYRCPSGHPGVVKTLPRLPNGTPFPTVYYLTCPRIVSACSTLEASGLMAEMTARLEADAGLAARYRAAHEAYLADRETLGHVDEIDGISAGGMPTRVKCLHVLVGHALAAGRGVNPLGDEALDAMGDVCPPDARRTVAAVDCGTNSVRLLIQRADKELVREVRLARLGQGVDATGAFHPDALARTFAVLDEYARIIADHGVDEARFVATSAARDVSNRDVFEAGVRARLGVGVDVISGEEEARLSAAGVLSGVTSPRPTLIFDIGGGSTELVVVGEDGEVASAVSLDIGAVRITERFLRTDPPTAEEREAARACIGELIDGAGVDFAALASAIGVAGTVTSVAADHLGLREYSREAVHGSALSAETIHAISGRWLGQTADEIATQPLMHPLRAAVIGGGSMILDEIVARVPGRRILVSETDILDGIAHRLLTRRRRP
jgi:exopolyphosphatase/guanosine-5'-triphosphate,3'-diphosphate pyrophosphatase